MRAGDKGQHVKHNLQHDIVTIEWDFVGDLRNYPTKESLKQKFSSGDPSGYERSHNRSVGRQVAKLLAFRDEIERSDIVVMPLKDRDKNQYVAIGQVTGAYEHDAAHGPGVHHRLPVEWLAERVHRRDLGDLVGSINSGGTLFEIDKDKHPASRLLNIAVPSLSGDEAGLQSLGGRAVPEGAAERIEVIRYERNVENRAACLEHFGYRCRVCDLDFEERYGDLGRGYMHVHHVIPLHQVAMVPNYRVDPIRDLRPVCPNCHAMLHRPKDRTLTVEELRELLRPERSNNG
ncbi:HNH endonuclease [Candidatus Poriferisodalis multihospitum]|uniref:HNH endonuclease n=1 Tax=Candidatus Poriferisodalis multihospitum TaxID=2983191 RepID=UPI002B25A5FF|nr:HNH endonuclease [Candidatus Poriferisodalis multihospitum]